MNTRASLLVPDFRLNPFKDPKWRVHPRLRFLRYHDLHLDSRGHSPGKSALDTSVLAAWGLLQIIKVSLKLFNKLKNGMFVKEFFLVTYRIRKAGFAIRYTFGEFVNRYHVIMKDLKLPRDSPQEMTEALAKAFLNDVEWTIGHRMIFLKVNRSFSMADLHVVMAVSKR